MSSTVATAPTRLDVERLSSLGERFRVWRMRQGKSYFKMPPTLWDEAFGFIPLFGARRVAREIGLSRDELLRQMNEAQGPAAASVPASPLRTSTPEPAKACEQPIQFMELEMEWPGVASPPAAAEKPSTMAAPVAPVAASPAPTLAVPTDPIAVAADSAPAQSTTPAGNTALEASASTAAEAVVEVLATDGTKLTVRIPVAHLNMSTLIHEFRSRA